MGPASIESMTTPYPNTDAVQSPGYLAPVLPAVTVQCHTGDNEPGLTPHL